MSDISFLVVIAIIIVIALVILIPRYYTVEDIKKLTVKSIAITSAWIIFEGIFIIMFPDLFFYLVFNRPIVFYILVSSILFFLIFTQMKLLRYKEDVKVKKSINVIYGFIGVIVAVIILYTIFIQ